LWTTAEECFLFDVSVWDSCVEHKAASAHGWHFIVLVWKMHIQIFLFRKLLSPPINISTAKRFFRYLVTNPLASVPF